MGWKPVISKAQSNYRLNGFKLKIIFIYFLRNSFVFLEISCGTAPLYHFIKTVTTKVYSQNGLSAVIVGLGV